MCLTMVRLQLEHRAILDLLYHPEYVAARAEFQAILLDEKRSQMLRIVIAWFLMMNRTLLTTYQYDDHCADG